MPHARPTSEGSKVCAAFALLCAIVAPSASCDDPQHPIRPSPTPRHLAAPVAETRARCPGGLLCEDPRPLHDYRVPWSCTDREENRRLARCRIAALPWQQIEEFFTSRYRDIEIHANGLRVRGLAGVPLPGDPSPSVSSATRDPMANLRTPARLEVRRTPDGATIVAIRGSAPTPRRHPAIRDVQLPDAQRKSAGTD